MYTIQPYVIKFVMTGGRSKVYSIQPYVIEFVMTGDRSEVYSIRLTLCDKVGNEWGRSEVTQYTLSVIIHTT